MRFAADENFSGTLLDALLTRIPELDIVRVQDTALYGAPDPAVLEWAANEGRILLTHDVNTMVKDAYSRVHSGLIMPGVILVATGTSIGEALEHLEIMIGAGTARDFENLVKHVPIR